MIKNSNGITLVAVIVTIIVMLILVSVTISITTNDNIISKTNDAKFKTEVSKILEQWNMVKAKLEMKDVSYKDMNYDLKDALKNYKVTDEFDKKLKINRGEIVYLRDNCSKQEKDIFESMQIYSLY